MTGWIAESLGCDIPLHFTAFHPDWKMLDRPPTPPSTLRRARTLALANGLRFVYTGNVRDLEGDRTECARCRHPLIERDRYEILAWRLDSDGACPRCGERCPGVFEAEPGTWGARRRPVRVGAG